MQMAGATVSSILTFGATGPVVAELQTKLTQLGLATDIHGIYDRETTEAVKLFQQMQRLPITGDADAKTLAALGASMEEKPAAASAPPTQEVPPNVVPIRPDLAQSVKDMVKSTSLVPTQRVQVMGELTPQSMGQSFFKSPLFKYLALAGAVAGAYWLYSYFSEPEPFDAFEDAESLDPAIIKGKVISMSDEKEEDLGKPPKIRRRRS